MNSRFVFDVTEQTFAQEVITRSHETPVVVDFWAAWCGPCRVLGPVLEKLANEFAGGFLLAKLDVDKAPRLSQQYGVQGIPAVKAFKQGRVLNEFVGAIPEPQVRNFLRGIVPNEADRLAAAGEQAESQGRLDEAETAYEHALSAQADHAGALLGLLRVRLAQERISDAEILLSRLPLGSAEAAEAKRQLIRAQLQAEAAQHGGEGTLIARVQSAPNDLESKFALGRLYLGQERHREGLDLLLEIVRADRKFQDDAARKTMLDAFAVLGEENPLTIEYRRRLSNALF